MGKSTKTNLREKLVLFQLSIVLGVSLMWSVPAGIALAQTQVQPNVGSTPRPAQDNDITRRELGNFDRFLDEHPNVAKELNNNPSVINDQGWLSKHPQLQTFLKNHPGVREEMKENPARFMQRERRYEREGRDITRGELERFDRFLDSHPKVAEELRKDPKLIDKKEFVENHPELREFLKNHPRVREDLKEHPRAFMGREHRYERHEGRARK